MKSVQLVCLLTLLLFNLELYAQNATADLHFESAEKAYNEGKYKEVLTKLDEVEKLMGPTSRTLYLRIITQDKLFHGRTQNIDNLDFPLLSNLRDNVDTYLEVMESHGLDDRYREVFKIGESLNKHPKTLAEIQHIREKARLEKQEKEDRAYQTAVASDKVADYRNFLSAYANSDRAAEVRQRMNTASDRDAYQSFLTSKNSTNAQTYLRSFPNGAHHAEILVAYEELLYEEGLKHEKQGELDKARERFSTYKARFSNGKHIAEVDSKLSSLSGQIERKALLEKIDNRTYGIFSYATNGTFGLELGRLPGKGLGLYLKGQANGPGFQVGKASETITAEELATSDEYKVGIIGGSIGVNYYVTYPLWLYAGVGVSFQPYYSKEKDRSFTLEGRKDLVFFPEFGVKSRVANAIVLKAGVQLIPGGTALQIGIGF